MSKKALPALLAALLLTTTAQAKNKEASRCSRFFLSAGVGFVHNDLTLNKANTSSSGGITSAQIDKAKAAYDNAIKNIIRPADGPASASLLASIRDATPLSNSIMSYVSFDGGYVSTSPLPAFSVSKDGKTFYALLTPRDASGTSKPLTQAQVNAALDQALAMGVEKFVFNAANVTNPGITSGGWTPSANAAIDQLTSLGGAQSFTTSPQGASFQAMGGYRKMFSQRIGAGVAGYLGFGTGRGRADKINDKDILKSKEGLHYGAEVHLGTCVVPSTFIFVKGAVESTSFRFHNYHSVGKQTKPDTIDGTARITLWRPGIGLGVVRNIWKRFDMGVDYTYLFSGGGKNLTIGGYDEAATTLTLGKVKGPTHRIMFRLIANL